MEYEEKHLCRVCGEAATKRCSACHEAEYCGEECQAADWEADHCFECGEGSVGTRYVNFTLDEVTSGEQLTEKEFMYVTSEHPKNYMWFGSIPLRIVTRSRRFRGVVESTLDVRPGYIDRYNIRRDSGIYFLQNQGETRFETLQRFARVLRRYGDAISRRYYRLIGGVRPEPGMR